MKFTLTESEKKEILSMYQKKNLVNEKLDLNKIKLFIGRWIPSLRQKLKRPFFFVQETPDKTFRLWIKDNGDPKFQPVDYEKLFGKGEIDYQTREEAQRIADISNETIAGTPFKSNPKSGWSAQALKDDKALQEYGYKLVENNEIDLPDGVYFSEGLRVTVGATKYNPNDPKAPVNYNSNIFKIKTEDSVPGKDNVDGNKGDTGYAVLTRKTVIGDLRKDPGPGVGSKVEIKNKKVVWSSLWDIEGVAYYKKM